MNDRQISANNQITNLKNIIELLRNDNELYKGELVYLDDKLFKLNEKFMQVKNFPQLMEMAKIVKNKNESTNLVNFNENNKSNFESAKNKFFEKIHSNNGEINDLND